MFPIDPTAPRPEIPHSERIFAASKELHDAYARGEDWTKAMPLHEACVIFFLETISDAAVAVAEKWHNAGRIGTCPDTFAIQHELQRIICLEDNRGRDEQAPCPEAAS